ncbi:hypothetical protein ES703_04300 [subsurface metagenome]
MGKKISIKVLTLFIASLGASLIVHVLVLFGSLWNPSREDSQKESYRVTLIQEPIRDISKDVAIDRQDLSTVQTEPIPDTETVTNQAENRKQPSAITDKAEPEYEPKSADQRDQERRSPIPTLPRLHCISRSR